MKNKILNILKSADDYVSGEAISRELSVSRSAVWKHIKTLRNEGYTITSVTNKGYHLEEYDVLREDEITSRLNTKFIGQNIICLDKTDSTNNEAKRNSSLPEGTVFVSDIQTGGKGRRGKNWSSPGGVGAWFSLLLKPNIRPETVSRITLAAGLAVCKALGDKAMIKYPNDIVMGSKKICGILTELSAETDAVNYVVCGMGINVNTPSFSEELKHRATSVFIETNKKSSRAEIIADVLNEFEILYNKFLQNGLTDIIDEYKSRCVTLNREVNVTYEGKALSGVCSDIMTDGSIVIENKDGKFIINSGEVSVRGIYGYV